MSKLKLLIFHQALAPYRIDQFNNLSQLFDLEVVFIFDNVWNHKFDQSKLISQTHFKHSFLLHGPRYKGRVFRFGMLKTIRRINPDIIFGYEYSFSTLYLVLLKKLGLISQKIGSTIDDSLDICHNVQSKVRFLARKHIVRRLDYLVVLSYEVSEFYQSSFNFKAQQIIVSPILQDPKRLRSNSNQLEIIAEEYTQTFKLEGKKVLLFVGRFITQKALIKFITTIQHILQKQSNLVLILVGDGPDRESIEWFINKTHLEEKILLPGRYEGQELYAWYLCASGFVLPSLYEPFGAVVNEALIFGLNVFCSKYAGASCLVNPHVGMLFDPLSEKETIVKLHEFLVSIDVVKIVCLTHKTSLMHNFNNYIDKEWGKLSND